MRNRQNSRTFFVVSTNPQGQEINFRHIDEGNLVLLGKLTGGGGYSFRQGEDGAAGTAPLPV